MNNKTDIHWLTHALQLAQHAKEQGEVPIGAVLVLDNEIIGEGWNQPISTKDPAAHAEIIALRAGAKKINNYRLLNATLYVTLEPCIMCIGAMIHARIKRLVYGAADPKIGASNLLTENKFNHQLEYAGNILGAECSAILKDFFRTKRK